MAPDVETKILVLRESGQLQVLSGRIVEVNRKRGRASVRIRPRGSVATSELEVSRIVACRGMTSDPRKSANPLVAQLLAEGYARVDRLCIGLDVDDDLRAHRRQRTRLEARLCGGSDEPSRFLGGDCSTRHSFAGRVARSASYARHADAAVRRTSLRAKSILLAIAAGSISIPDLRPVCRFPNAEYGRRGRCPNSRSRRGGD